MIITTRIRSWGAVIATSGVLSAAVYYYKKRNTIKINEVMVFCKLQFNAYDYFDRLIGYVESAKKSINVCMSSIHNPAIQSRLVALLNNNVKIRIIIDIEGYNETTQFLLKELIAAGAEIKIKYNSQLVHKFCLIDDKVLVIGTLDWGIDRSADTWNYVYITNRVQLVKPVKMDFYYLWNNYSYNLEIKNLEITPPIPINKRSTDLNNTDNASSIISLD